MECHRRLGKWPSGLASLVGLTAAVTLVLRCAFWVAPRPLAGCRAESPLLVGPRPVNLSSSPPTLEEIGKRSASVLPGGLYHPPDCEAQHRVAIVVPYRKRAMHLRALLCHLHPFLQRQQIHYRIYVVEQWGDGTFNKGKLLNAGVREVLRDEDWSCIVIHDVDLLAENDRNLYTCDKCNPTHLAVAIDKFHYRLPYRHYFGGVVAVTPDQYRKMNGFSNQYWGWGREDDDLWQRVALAGMKVMRPPLAIARYKMIKHHRDRGNEENPYNFVLRNRTALAWYVDGLNSLTYKLLSKEQEPLYTRLAINVGEKPRPWVQEEMTTDKTATSRD
ncbi:beta-1,4-galactosyltransferase 3-like [Syngnathus acus]|uniref:beta-1,4-galactosyltransferase 3-like n=1 Tax=Syngnathus acus TaxID=161584 RepID=UPI001885FE86|nr:beta-1,4-galactosyltransferase 3-like [Syngnathus acus]